MKKHDLLFSASITISTIVLGALVADNLFDSVHEEKMVAERQMTAPAETVKEDPASSAALQKKFEKMGLKLHAGKYWRQAD